MHKKGRTMYIPSLTHKYMSTDQKKLIKKNKWPQSVKAVNNSGKN